MNPVLLLWAAASARRRLQSKSCGCRREVGVVTKEGEKCPHRIAEQVVHADGELPAMVMSRCCHPIGGWPTKHHRQPPAVTTNSLLRLLATHRATRHCPSVIHCRYQHCLGWCDVEVPWAVWKRLQATAVSQDPLEVPMRFLPIRYLHLTLPEAVLAAAHAHWRWPSLQSPLLGCPVTARPMPVPSCSEENKRTAPLVQIAYPLALDERVKHPPPGLLLYGSGSVSWTYSSEPDLARQACSMYELQRVDLPLNSECWH